MCQRIDTRSCRLASKAAGNLICEELAAKKLKRLLWKLNHINPYSSIVHQSIFFAEYVHSLKSRFPFVRSDRSDQSVFKWNARVLRTGSGQNGPAHAWFRAAQFSRSGQPKRGRLKSEAGIMYARALKLDNFSALHARTRGQSHNQDISL